MTLDGRGHLTEAVMSWDEAVAQLTVPGQQFEIDHNVIRGIRTRVWKQAPPSLQTLMELSLFFPEEDFLVYEDERTTFAQHYRIAATLAHRLQHHGIAKGDRVAIAMRNLPEWVMAFWGAALAGAVVVPLNAWWTSEELRYGLEDSGSTAVFADRERAERIRPHLRQLPALRTLVVADEDRAHDGTAPWLLQGGAGVPSVGPELDDHAAEWSFADFLGEVGADVAPPQVPVEPDDDATIFYTSGTTGRPKGAVGSHRNACSNLMNLYFATTVGALRYPKMSGDSPTTRNVYLLSVPLFHATGCFAVMMTYLASGGRLVMMHHFDPQRALQLIERERVTTFGGVPSMAMQVLDVPDIDRYDTSSVRNITYGGAPAPSDLVRRIRERFPVGLPGNGYGLTETSAMTALNSGADYVAKPDSVGPPMPVCEVAIVPEDYQGDEPSLELPRGPEVVGELWIRGPNVVRGYWHRPEETALVFTRGWLHTGDIARLDEDGYIAIVDRAKDVIIRGGENVYSVEVEDVLYRHPAVADCAVIGVPDPVLGEVVGAVVVLKPGMKLTADALGRHVSEHLAAFSVPSRFWFRTDPIPRNPAGKALKRALRDELLSGSAEASPADTASAP